jgi:hypothetical protein
MIKEMIQIRHKRLTRFRRIMKDFRSKQKRTRKWEHHRYLQWKQEEFQNVLKLHKNDNRNHFHKKDLKNSRSIITIWL